MPGWISIVQLDSESTSGQFRLRTPSVLRTPPLDSAGFRPPKAAENFAVINCKGAWKLVVHISRNLKACSESGNLRGNKKNARRTAVSRPPTILKMAFVSIRSLVRARRPTYRDFGIMTCSLFESPESSESAKWGTLEPDLPLETPKKPRICQ